MGNRIIVVDDEMMALQNFLLGTVDSAKDVDFAFFGGDPAVILEYAGKHRVDGAFLDINMPEMDGFELGRKLVSINPDIRLVYVTGLVIDSTSVPKDLRPNLTGFAYKPIDEEAIAGLIDSVLSRSLKMKVTMFGGFDCSLNGRSLRFSSSKSRELFAFLLVHRGKSVTMDEAITAIWPDTDVLRAKKLYRDAVWRLRKTLNETSFPCIEFKRAMIYFNPDFLDSIACDYWDCLDGKTGEGNSLLLPSYDWSIDYQNELDCINYSH